MEFSFKFMYALCLTYALKSGIAGIVSDGKEARKRSNKNKVAFDMGVYVYRR
jgi:hypothetical protein